ncbi:MAG: protein kinase [Polyangiaceae bacterium]|nr:protein kinase [Polyangiaceae bacterium]
MLPLEHFEGITLTTWVLRYGPDSRGTSGAAHSPADLRTRLDLWLRLATAIEAAHVQGVIHRLLRADVVLVEDRKEPREVRVTGFDLAKQIGSDGTITLPPQAEDRLITAAPEVVLRFSDASPASDQFSLGAILALLLTGKPLFESTRQLSAAGRLLRRVQDIAPRVSLRLDEAVQRMLALRSIERFPTLADAMTAVRAGRDTDARSIPPPPEAAPALDPDDLPAGARVGADYEILGRLGQGGMAIVYAAKHVVSGRTRALKIARTSTAAEDAIRGEYEALVKLDHPNVVRVIDLTRMVEGRTTLVMERVGGGTLRQWRARLTAESRRADPSVERRLAEDLLAGLEIPGDPGGHAQGPQARQPARRRRPPHHHRLQPGLDARGGELRGHGAVPRPGKRALDARDRSLPAALCLFELYAGRHAFEGRAPEPGLAPQIDDEDIEPSGLAAFFRKALDPSIERRFPSARAMRDALLVALGEDTPAPASRPAPPAIDASTPLRLSGLSQRAVHALERCQVTTVAELLALPAEQVRAIHAMGSKTAREILALQGELRARGVGEGIATTPQREPAVVPELSRSPEPVQKLPLGSGLRDALARAGFPTIGAVASLSLLQLRQVTGVGPRKATAVVAALHQFRDRSPADQAGSTLDALWDLASRPLSPLERLSIERCVGITGEPEVQGDVAASLGKSQPAISVELREGLGRIDRAALAEVERAMEDLLDSFGGLVRASAVAARLEEEWSPGTVSGIGLVRLLVRLSSRAHLVELDETEPLLAQPVFDRDTLRAFAAAVHRFASTWPPVEPEAARRALSALIPQYHGDPLALGVRLAEDVEIAETGHLFIPPLDPHHSLDFVLRHAREPIPFAELGSRVRRIFGEGTPVPADHDHLISVLANLDCQVQGDVVLPGRTGSVLAPAPLPADDAPAALQVGVGASRTPEEIVRDMLRDAATSRGFRMLVVPPESMAAVGRSVASAIGGRFVSFEDAFFGAHAAELPALERAERFSAQRGALTEAAEATLFELLEEHGNPGNVIVLGDTALLALCEALDLPRRLYDETLSGSRGFWVLVVPGVIHNRQPRFNEDLPMWHLEGATLPLMRELGGEGSPPAAAKQGWR